MSLLFDVVTRLCSGMLLQAGAVAVPVPGWADTLTKPELQETEGEELQGGVVST